MTDENENEWINNLKKLNNEYSQMLYLIFYLEKNNYIYYEQKIFLKKLLLTNPQNILPLLNELKLTNNFLKFCESIIKLIPIENSKENFNETNDNYMNKSTHLITISNDSWIKEKTKEDNCNE